jgi:hypothetical protein
MEHLLRFYSGGGKPTMLYRKAWDANAAEGGSKDGTAQAARGSGAADAKGEAGSVTSLELSGFCDIDFSGRLSCIGYRTPESYLPCANSAIHTRQCPTCAARDVSKAYTVGDFSGYPTLYEEAKTEEYCLYLAGFGSDIVKCGVTRKERFSERMREQGADFGCIAAVFMGPDEIYGAEAAVQSRFNYSNSVRIAQKMRRLEFDEGKGRGNFESAVELLRASSLLPDFSPRIEQFSQSYPPVKRAQEAHSILGEILGAKGEILFFRSEGGRHFAVNMRQKVGMFFSLPGKD